MEKKLRHSHQREMIYEYLYASKEHPSAEMIYEDLKKIEPTLSLGTVYRNLKLLEELGKIKKVTSVNNIERYDCCCEDHVHFICDKCGRVLDLPDFNKEIIINCLNEENKHNVQWVNILIGGTCSECMTK